MVYRRAIVATDSYLSSPLSLAPCIRGLSIANVATVGMARRHSKNILILSRRESQPFICTTEHIVFHNILSEDISVRESGNLLEQCIESESVGSQGMVFQHAKSRSLRDEVKTG